MAKFAINEAFLQQLETLQTILKNNIAGLFGGNHKSKTFGSSCEFTDYRDYLAGDDLTKIDWNAYARFDKLYLKLYLDERQLHTRIYIDASRSMDFGKGKKAEQALQIAAAIAYLSVCEMDKVSIYFIQEKEVHEVAVGMVGREAFYNAIGKLNDIEFRGDSYLSEAILPSKVGYGDGLSVLISDFLTDNDYDTAIDHLTDKHRDVCCIQILSQEELNPLIRGKVRFFDCESNARLYQKNINRDIAKAYRKALEYTINRIRDYCLSRSASYLMIPADKPIGDVFLQSFAQSGVVK